MFSSFGEPFSKAKRNQKRNARTVFRVRRHFQRENVGNQRLATIGEPYRWILSRVRCIALFARRLIPTLADSKFDNGLRKCYAADCIPRSTPIAIITTIATLSITQTVVREALSPGAASLGRRKAGIKQRETPTNKRALPIATGGNSY